MNNHALIYFFVITDTPPLEVKTTPKVDVSNQILTKSSSNKIARKQNQTTASSSKDSESKKREDLTSLGSDDSGKVFREEVIELDIIIFNHLRHHLRFRGA